MSKQLLHGALYFFEPPEALVRADTFMDGALLGVVTTSGEARFYASLCRVYKRTPEEFPNLPQFWSTHIINRVLCGSAEEGWQLVERAVASLTDTHAPNYSFKRTAATGCGTIMRRSAAAA